MSPFVGSNILAGASGQGGAAGYRIERSLRFNDDDDANLSFTPSTSSSMTTYTWSFWFKRSTIGNSYNMLYSTNGEYGIYFYFRYDQIDIGDYYGNSYQWRLQTVRLFRDISAWYHIVVAVDTTQATASDRVKMYINGVQETSFSIESYPSQNSEGSVNRASIDNRIGEMSTAGNFDGYLAEFHSVDGQQLSPTDFGEYDNNNLWQPKEYSGTYNTNGFYLDFSDNSSTSALGTDSSGNNNDWTANNISVSSGSGNDSLIDTPTNYEASSGNNGGNYATLNPLDRQSTNGVLSNGNLDIKQTAAAWAMYRSTMFVSSGKWYWEVTIGNNQYTTIGICSDVYQMASGSNNWANASSEMFGYYPYDGNVYNGSNTISYATGDTSASGSIIGVALDMDNGTLTFYKDGTSLGQATSGLTGKNVSPTHWLYSQTGADSYNFGQRPFFYAPGSSGGPSSDFKSLCTTNLPQPVIADGSTAMDVVTYSGDGTNGRAITGINHSPDLVWIKARNQVDGHLLYDIVRGATKALKSNNNNAEATDSNSLTAFNSDGFTVGSNASNAQVNQSGFTYVGWTWDAGTVANPVGDIWQGSATKYIGVKFSSASGGTISFGQTSGSTTVEVWKSSDNSNWTQQGGTLTLSDGHTLTFTDQYVYIRNTSNATFSNWYAAATNGADGHYSSATYPGGAYFTGPAYTDYDWRESGGTLIPAGGLNSSAYLYGDWTSMVTGNYSSAHGWGTTYQTANAFDGNLATMVIPDGSQGWTFTPSTPIAGSTIEIYGWNDGCPNNGLVINGNNYGDALGADQTVGQWYTLPYSTLNSIVLAGDGSAGSSEFRLIAIRIDGKMLIQTGTSVTNVPTIASTVRANPSAGFSVISYTGNGTRGETVGHGLNAVPGLLIVKNRSTAASNPAWGVKHSGLYSNPAAFMKLESTDAFIAESASAGALFNATNPGPSVFTLGDRNTTNSSGDDYIAYCWTPVEGYSAMGSYTGNGSTDGPFVYTGFRPAFVLLKCSSAASTYWSIHDNKRLGYNPDQDLLFPNTADAENATSYMDFLSNGFKLRISSSFANASGQTFIYYAVAENPFKTARAR